MNADYILRGARVIDPAAGTDEIRDVYIREGRIVPTCGAADCSPDRIVDVHGCIVTPGLIDYHAHVFHTGSTIAIEPDALLAQGTTTVVDAGTAGCANYELFEASVMENAAIRIMAYLNVYDRGQEDAARPENFDPALFDREGMRALIMRYGAQLLGLKLRLSRGIVPEKKAAEILRESVALADWLQERTGKRLRLCVHVTDSPIPAGVLASMLRPGDIFCHCFQGKGSPILAENGGIDDDVLRARERGVLFDAANGRGNFSLSVAREALRAGFLPDIISSDLTVSTFYKSSHVRSLPHVISKYLSLGLSLPEILRRCTETPAKLLGEEGELGTLRPGAVADVAVFRLTEQTWEQEDFRGERIHCEQLLVPQMTFLGGRPI
ncbi:MAG: amidohydrolase family protein [Lachnospiraceae bacterium]|nr:amidohydrolase family protein [Lachnospiraceae bacterium]